MRARQQAFVQLEGKDFAKVQEVDRLARTLSITKSGKRRDEHPTALFAFEYVNVEKIEAAIYRLAEDVAEAGSLANAPKSAAVELLLRRPPRVSPSARDAPGERTAPVPRNGHVSQHLDRAALTP